MDKPILNFETFELPFFIETKDHLIQGVSDDENEEEEEDTDMVKENMESRIPSPAIYLGPVEGEVENGPTTWITRDEYYIYPLQSEEYDWAVFRISWDDNWGRWQWSSDGRIKGLEASYKEAARLILYELWKQWQLDLNDSENKSYVNFIEQFK